MSIRNVSKIFEKKINFIKHIEEKAFYFKKLEQNVL